MHLRRRLLLLVVFQLLGLKAADARAVPLITLAELEARSDLVLVIEAERKEENRQTMEVAGFAPALFQGMTYFCTVHAVLKGEHPLNEPAAIHLFRYRNGIRPPNGAGFVALPISEIDLKLVRSIGPQGTASSSGRARPRFLAFLKRDRDGLSPATGHYDADDSFLLLSAPGVASGEFE